ncbi:MAG: response regulator transcription factor [Anaerolineae bacterium]
MMPDAPKAALSPAIRVLIVDDHPIMRGGLRKLLELEADLQVVAEAGTGEEAITLTQSLMPDVLLLDVNLPALNGFEVTARLKALRARTAVIILTAYDEREQMVYAMRAGAAAYCPKNIEPDRLFEVIRLVAGGRFVIEDATYNESGIRAWLELNAESAPSADGEERPASLSRREMEILRCVTRGLHNKAIAQELGISHQTVRNHVTSILTKLNVRGRTQAAVYALTRGWVRVEEFNPPLETEND